MLHPTTTWSYSRVLMTKTLPKVVSIVHYYPPHVGGMEVVVRNIADSLVRMGYRATVLTCALPGQKKGLVKEHGVNVLRGRAMDFCDPHLNFPYPIPSLGMIRMIRREIRDADIVHINDVFYVTSWVAYLWSVIYRKPVVLTQHVAMVDYPSKIVMMVERLVYKTIGKLMFKQARVIVTYNHIVKQFLLDRKVDPEKLFEIRIGVDTKFFVPANAARKKALRKKYGLPLDRPLVLF